MSVRAGARAMVGAIARARVRVKFRVRARAWSRSRPSASVSVSVRAWFRVWLGFPLRLWLG